MYVNAGKSDGVCKSPGGRFPPFASEGKPPKKVSKGPKDLTLCRLFRKKTCCDVAQTHLALLSVRRLAVTGEASQECLQLWELLECSLCDPHIGVQPGPPLICDSLCDRVYKACSNAYFSMDVKTQVCIIVRHTDFRKPIRPICPVWMAETKEKEWAHCKESHAFKEIPTSMMFKCSI